MRTPPWQARAKTEARTGLGMIRRGRQSSVLIPCAARPGACVKATCCAGSLRSALTRARSATGLDLRTGSPTQVQGLNLCMRTLATACFCCHIEIDIGTNLGLFRLGLCVELINVD